MSRTRYWIIGIVGLFVVLIGLSMAAAPQYRKRDSAEQLITANAMSVSGEFATHLTAFDRAGQEYSTARDISAAGALSEGLGALITRIADTAIAWSSAATALGYEIDHLSGIPECTDFTAALSESIRAVERLGETGSAYRDMATEGGRVPTIDGGWLPAFDANADMVAEAWSEAVAAGHECGLLG